MEQSHFFNLGPLGTILHITRGYVITGWVVCSFTHQNNSELMNGSHLALRPSVVLLPASSLIIETVNLTISTVT